MNWLTQVSVVDPPTVPIASPQVMIFMQRFFKLSRGMVVRRAVLPKENQ